MWLKRGHGSPEELPSSVGPVALAPVEMSSPLEEEASPKFSALRILAAIVILGGAGYGAFVGLRSRIQAPSTNTAATLFAPYVDVTLTPTYQFQAASSNPARQSVLGFVVAASAKQCTPSWGGYFSIAQANRSLVLSSRIAKMDSSGAQAIISFGGQKNTDLAVACPTATALANAYQSVIDAYNIHAIDLDIEGPALGSFAALQRRASAIRILEQRAALAHKPLQVWLTLPVLPSGLQDNALSVIQSMLKDRVHLTGINVMAMDFTVPPAAGTTMLALVERSMESVHDQIKSMLPRYGIHLHSGDIWRLLGVTVMIGQNNISGEQFTTADAAGLKTFAEQKRIARVSIWSVNRDQPCAQSYGVPMLSNTCSSTSQTPLEFSTIFSGLNGSIDSTTSGRPLLRPALPDLNPANAPFPQWDPQAAYVTGYKVVDQGEIYQAKWYNSGQDPTAQYQYSWQSPWELLGPVLVTDHVPEIPSLSAGTYPAWSPTKLYVAGTRVLYQGLAYQAKWSSQDIAPSPGSATDSSAPWQPQFNIPGEPSTAAS